VHSTAGASDRPSDRVRLVGVRDTPLSVPECLAAVGDAAAGGIALFVGTVRAADAGRPVTTLEYSAHPSAVAVLADIAAEVARAEPVTALAVIHRVGPLVVGDLAVVVAAAAPHRAEAFAAARRLVEDVKARVPIWKHQTFANGTEEWVGTP
jgi:molybdopterin synthase catalytic subunit